MQDFHKRFFWLPDPGKKLFWGVEKNKLGFCGNIILRNNRRITRIITIVVMITLEPSEPSEPSSLSSSSSSSSRLFAKLPQPWVGLWHACRDKIVRLRVFGEWRGRDILDTNDKPSQFTVYIYINLLPLKIFGERFTLKIHPKR